MQGRQSALCSLILRETGWHGGGTLPAFAHAKEATVMNLVIWLPAMFGLGLGTMILCYAFIGACEKI